MATLESADLARVGTLMRKYADAPMDFAAATLVLVADKTRTPQVLTLDDDFLVYRTQGNKAFELVLGD